MLITLYREVLHPQPKTRYPFNVDEGANDVGNRLEANDIVDPVSSNIPTNIPHGNRLAVEEQIEVYFIKADVSERAYKGWTCGGSIVSPEYILTSAACVEDVKFMYAIAGYKKFVEYEKIDLNNCTKQTAFDFKDASYLEHQCSYIPAVIQINYEQRYQDP
ncbi:Uncharacterized protein OBRU01_23846, partial [Operophtera brumata]